MKLNVDCVRDILLEFETFPMGVYFANSFNESIKKYSYSEVLYCLLKLSEAGYINAEYYRSSDGHPHVEPIYDITFLGHEFLEKIRSDGIWNNSIKPVLSQVGSKSFDVIIQIATSTISSLIAKQLGITI